MVWQRPSETHPLTPVYEDAFRMPGGMIRFRRGGAGRVSQLSLGVSRVFDMRFDRVER